MVTKTSGTNCGRLERNTARDAAEAAASTTIRARQSAVAHSSNGVGYIVGLQFDEQINLITRANPKLSRLFVCRLSAVLVSDTRKSFFLRQMFSQITNNRILLQ